MTDTTAATVETPAETPAPVPTPLEALATRLAERLGAGRVTPTHAAGELTLALAPADLVETVSLLRADTSMRFTTLVDITAVDHPGRSPRFDVVYHLLSMWTNLRLRLRVAVSEGDLVPSLVDVHPSANWFEREVFDMFGLVFSGHPDLRRLLTDYGFRGHPLRKDFPTTGYTEVRWDEVQKRVVYEPVSLVQEYRQFDFESPWEGGAHADPTRTGTPVGPKVTG